MSRALLRCLCVLLFVGLSGLLRSAETQAPAPQRLSLNLPSITLGTFLSIVSKQTGMKLVTSAELAKTPLSVYLPDVTPREALNAICDAYDLYYEQIEGTDLYVVRRSDTAFFRLEHIDAKDIQEVIAILLGGQVGATTATTTATGGVAAGVTIDEKNNVIAVRGSRTRIEKVRRMLEEIDRTPPQVLIEAVLVELTDQAEKELGIRWDVIGTFRGAARKTRLPFRKAFVSEDEEEEDAWIFGFVNFQDFLAELRMMERNGLAKILASPRVTAVDKKEALIKIVANMVIAKKLTYESEEVELVTEEPIYAEVGVVLKTLPRIHPDGRVTLLVEPSVSTASRSTFVEEAVDTFDRSATTTVVCTDGEMIAIGGLLRTDETVTLRTLPYISGIPLLGKLFTRKDRNYRRTDLVVFLTPTLLNTERIAENVEKERARVTNKENELRRRLGDRD